MSIFGAWIAGYLEIDGVDLSDHVREMMLETTVIELPDNVHGDNTAKVRAGLESWQIGVTFLQDFAIGSIDATLKPLTAVATPPFNIVIGGKQDNPSETDPWYKGFCIVTSYVPLRGPHGANLEILATFQVAGGLQRITSITADQRVLPLDHTSRVRPMPHPSRSRPSVYTSWP